MGKVTLLVIGLFIAGTLAAPAMAVTYQNSWSSPYYYSPYGSYYGYPTGSYYGYPSGLGGIGGTTDLGSIYGSSGPFGMSGYGYSPYGSGYGYSPYGSGYSPYGSGYSPYGSYYSTPSTTNSLPSTDLFSNLGSSSPFGNLFGGSSVFKAKQYGPPPTANITKALVGQRLTYNSGYMGIPLQYQIENSDIGNITGTQYRGADAWKVRVGQQGYYWDVIMDEAGDNILSETQVQ